MEDIVVYNAGRRLNYEFRTREMRDIERERLEDIIKLTNPLVKPSDLLGRLFTPNSCISGGGAVYAAGGSSIDVVDDIDIFILDCDKETFMQIYQSIVSAFLEVTVFTRESVVTIFPFNYDGSYTPKIPSFQLIYSNNVCPEEVIHNFDLDYVQCAFWDNKLIQTSYSENAIKNRAIYYRVEDLRYHRIVKALRKGYMINTSKPQSSFIVFEEDGDKLVKKRISRYLTSDLMMEEKLNKYDYLMKIGYAKISDPSGLTCEKMKPINLSDYDNPENVQQWIEHEKQRKEDRIQYFRSGRGRGRGHSNLVLFDDCAKLKARVINDFPLHRKITNVFFEEGGSGSNVKACR